MAQCFLENYGAKSVIVRNKNPISSEYFSVNRANLSKKVDSSIPIILTAAGEVQRSADAAYRYRQDMNFWYVTGIDDPGYVLVIHNDTPALICPKQSRVKSIFDGVLTHEEIKSISGIGTVLTHEAGNHYLKKLLEGHKKIASLLPANALQRHYAIAPNPARDRLIKRLKRIRSGLEIMHIGKEFAGLRMRKQAVEIEAMQSAIDCTVEAFEKVKAQIANLSNEYELDGIMTGYFRSQNAKHAYEPIIAAGQRASILHYASNSEVYTASDNMLLFDVGAEVFNFAADISRTYSIGKPSSRLRDVHAAVCCVQEYAYGLLKPGTTMREYESKVEAEMGHHLKSLGLISVEKRAEIRQYFPHATSHHLGLDVHDAADYDAEFEEDMVLTVEPGIYIPNESLAVRVEDNIRITKTGVDILSSALSTDLH